MFPLLFSLADTILSWSPVQALAAVAILFTIGVIGARRKFLFSAKGSNDQFFYSALLIETVFFNLFLVLFPDSQYTLPMFYQQLVLTAAHVAYNAYFIFYFTYHFRLQHLQFRLFQGGFVISAVAVLTFIFVHQLQNDVIFSRNVTLVLFMVYAGVCHAICLVALRRRLRQDRAGNRRKFIPYLIALGCQTAWPVFIYFNTANLSGPLGIAAVITANLGFVIIIKAYPPATPTSKKRGRRAHIMYTDLLARIIDANVHITEGERKVLELKIAEYQDKEIGEQLGITHNTVKTHMRSIYSKVDKAENK